MSAKCHHPNGKTRYREGKRTKDLKLGAQLMNIGTEISKGVEASFHESMMMLS